MSIKVLYFAGLREALGSSGETIVPPSGVATAGQLRSWLRERGGVWADELADGRSVRISVDQQMAEASTPLRAGAEVAFFPPVTGG